MHHRNAVGQGEDLVQIFRDQQHRAALLVDDALKPGRYEVLLHVGAYFAALGVALPSPNFLDRVPIRFQIRDPRQRYHLPVLFTPWGYSYYRGS